MKKKNRKKDLQERLFDIDTQFKRLFKNATLDDLYAIREFTSGIRLEANFKIEELEIENEN